MDTKRIEELSIPIIIGILVVIVGFIVASELLIIGIFLSFPSIIIGLGVGLLTLPVYRVTGVSYAPPAFKGSNLSENQTPTIDRQHFLFSVYYSYLSALLGFVIGISDHQLGDYSPLQIGIIAGLSIGFIFFVAYQVTTQKAQNQLSVNTIIASALLGFFLVLPGYSWWFLIGMPDV